MLRRLSELLLAYHLLVIVLTKHRPGISTGVPTGFINDHHTPHSNHHIQKQQFIRNGSDTSFHFSQPMHMPAAPPIHQGITRAASEGIQQAQPQPVHVSALPGRSRVAWNLGSED